jgi:hypothetical protein
LKFKLTKLSGSDDVKHVTETFTTNFEKIITGSNKDLDAINKYFSDLYTEFLKDEKVDKSRLAKIMKMIKDTINKVAKLARSGKVSDFDIYTFNYKSIPVMVIVGKNDQLVNKSVDHTSFKYGSSRFMAIFDNNTRNPLRVELKGIAYPIILTNRAGLKEIETNKEFEDIFLTNVYDISAALTTPNSFSAYKTSGIKGLADMMVERKKQAVEFVGSNILKDGLKKMNFDEEDVIVENALSAILLIGINSLKEAKILGDIIKKEKSKAIKKKIIKKLLGQS